jgi:fructosamine-3-kinase
MWSRLPFGEELRAQLGAPRRARRLGSSPRSRVWQVELGGAPAVVKQLVDAPGADDRYTREVTALRLAARVDPPVVPSLLGTDTDARVLVLEHLTHRRPSEDWVIAYAMALARLHAATGSDDIGLLPAWCGPAEQDIDSFLDLAERLAVSPLSGVRAELEGLVDRLSRTSGAALLHGDPCPGNDLHTVGGLRFIDFEQASLGSGLTELAYLRMGFPTCWCVTAPRQALLEEAEAAYRATWHASTGADLDAGLDDACAGWLLRGDALVERAHRGTVDHLARLGHKDWTWGTATARQRLAHRLGVVARFTAGEGELARLSALCADMRNRMLARWPELQPLPSRRP